jgi:hypothetical protein
MARNPRLLASHPMDDPGRAIGAGQRVAVIVALIATAALFGGGALFDHYDSVRRVANIQAALTAGGLGRAHVERVWKRVYRCRHAYLWRTATASGSACTDSFSSSVTIYGAGQQPLATAPPAAR